MIFEAIIFLLIIIIVTMSYVVYKLLERLSFYEDMFDSLSKPFLTLGKKITAMLSGTIYSNEPTIVDLVDSLREVNNIIIHLGEEYDMFASIEEGDELQEDIVQ